MTTTISTATRTAPLRGRAVRLAQEQTPPPSPLPCQERGSRKFHPPSPGRGGVGGGVASRTLRRCTSTALRRGSAVPGHGGLSNPVGGRDDDNVAILLAAFGGVGG